MINPAKLLKIKSMWSTFSKTHPKFPGFIRAVMNEGFEAGNIIEISVTTNDGKVMCSNIKLTESDIQMFNELKNQAK